MLQTSQQLWEVIERLHLIPSSDAARVKARWFRPDRAHASDPDQFGRWLVENGFVTKYDLKKISAGQTEELRLGQYLLLEPFTAGPHAGAYLASDTLGRKVLIDLVNPELAGDAELVRAFEGAAERAMGVQHPTVNRVLDFGHAQGRLYLVREFDEGATLAEVLARRSRLEPEQAARLFALAFAGLQALHEKQVQGGELGPGSLLLASTGKKGRVVKIQRPGMPHGLFGTQAGGRADLLSQLRPLSRPEDDLFRLGQTFYQSLTGQPSEAAPAGGASFRPVRTVAPDVPELLAETVEHLISPDVSARPRAAARVAKTLRVYLASEAGEARAEEEIASPVEVAAQPAPEPAAEEPDEEKPAKPQGKLGELWADVRPQQRDWFFLAGGAAGVIVLTLLLALLTGIHFVNVVCLLTGAALSFFAERLTRQRQGEVE